MWAHQAAWRRSVDSFWAAVWPGSETAWMPITSAGQTSHALRSIGLASCRVRGDRWVTSHTTAAGGRVSRQSRHCGGQGSLLGQTQHRKHLTCMPMTFVTPMVVSSPFYLVRARSSVGSYFWAAPVALPRSTKNGPQRQKC